MDQSFATNSMLAEEGDLPVLGSVKIPADAQLLPGCMNPEMDVTLLLRMPPRGAGAPSAQPQAPAQPMSVAQARMREMILRKQQQAQAAARGPSGQAESDGSKKPPEPSRGQPIKASLWRVEEDSTMIWEVALPRPDAFSLREDIQTAEKEECAIHGICWSPDGRRIAIQLCFTRTVTNPASSSSTGDRGGVRHCSVLALLATETGALQKCITLSQWSTSEVNVASPFADMTWTKNDSAPSLLDEDDVGNDSFSCAPLAVLRSLAPLPPLAELTSYGLGLDEKGSGAKALPHHLRFRQMMQGRGAAPEEPNILPSVAAKQIQGYEKATRALATLPTLPIDAVSWGLVEAVADDSGQSSVRLVQETDINAVLSDLLVCTDANSVTHLLGQGTVRVGELPASDTVPGHRLASCVASSNVSALSMISSEAAAGGSGTKVAVSLFDLPKSSSHAELIALSTTAHHLFSYLLDTLHLMMQVYRTTYIGQGAAEWQKHIEDAEQEYSCNFRLQCTLAIASGKLGDGIEVLLMSTINENALLKLEEATYISLRFFRRAVATAVGPTCERLMIVLKAIRARGFLPAGSDGGDSEAETLVQALLHASIKVELECEKDLLAAGEFYKWWKQERDKHENPRRDDRSFYPIIHDTLAAIEYVQRGFVNPSLKDLLSKTKEIITPGARTPKQPAGTAAVNLQERLNDLQQWQAKGMQRDRPSLAALQRTPINLQQAHGLFIGSISAPIYPPAKPLHSGSMSALASTALALVTDAVEPRIRGTVPSKPARLLASTPALPIAPPAPAGDLPDGQFFKTFTPEHGDLHCALVAYPAEGGGDEGLVLHFLEVDLQGSSSPNAAAIHVRSCRCSLRGDDGQALRLMGAGYLPAEDQLFLHLQGVRDPDTSISSRQVDLVGILRFQGQVPLADLHSMTAAVRDDADGDGERTPVQMVKPLQIARRARPVLQTDISVSRNTLGCVSGSDQEKRLVVLMTVVLP